MNRDNKIPRRRWKRFASSTVASFVLAAAIVGCGSDSGKRTIDGGTLALGWEPPGENEDGSGLTDLAGYRVYDGPAPGDYEMVTDVGTVTEVTLEDLDPGTYYVAVAAVDYFGNESALSSEIVVTIP